MYKLSLLVIFLAVFCAPSYQAINSYAQQVEFLGDTTCSDNSTIYSYHLLTLSTCINHNNFSIRVTNVDNTTLVIYSYDALNCTSADDPSNVSYPLGCNTTSKGSISSSFSTFTSPTFVSPAQSIAYFAGACAAQTSGAEYIYISPDLCHNSTDDTGVSSFKRSCNMTHFYDYEYSTDNCSADSSITNIFAIDPTACVNNTRFECYYSTQPSTGSTSTSTITSSTITSGTTTHNTTGMTSTGPASHTAYPSCGFVAASVLAVLVVASFF